MSFNDCTEKLDKETRENLGKIGKEKCKEWGGEWNEEIEACRVPCQNGYEEKTIVRSCKDGQEAFDKYSDYYENILDEEKESDCAVLVPCGAEKPIGSSGSAKKKAEAIEESEADEKCDTHIISEPCTIIPNDKRLSLPASNYDFPPEYAKEENCPEVFEEFTDNLAEWVEETEYEKLYPYLIEHHEEILEKSLEKSEHKPEVEKIPPSTYSEEAGRRVSDMFTSTEEISEKIDEMVD